MANRFFYEFFAGGGMARLGLGPDWTCLLANDIDPKKVATYQANFGKKEIVHGDVYKLRSGDLPGRADLAWASFPCQDLSLAGNRAGLAGERSGAFWGFWQAISSLSAENRAPRLLVLENVTGALSSHGGQDFRELAQAVFSLGYDFGALVIDAVHFLPQSRPRLFVVCQKRGEQYRPELVADAPIRPWHNEAVYQAYSSLPSHLGAVWRWWRLPIPKPRQLNLADMLERDDDVSTWHSDAETSRLLSMMSPTNLEKVKVAQASGERTVGTIYKRTRNEERLGRVQRAEVRFDGIAGCLRTPGGGSSRQIILVVDKKKIRSRLLTVREAANLMGVPKSADYAIPENYNDGYHIFGDGLAVPAVSFLREHLLDRLTGPALDRPTVMTIAAE
ncbi:DNA cytosine methyltransferase [Aestuariivirga sp.]|uniref:DNA cytosine methyltransferase n=1 Tax=Aestuariivirga sp. TaxID=2650926 RepID=UPI0025BAB4A9|nr:DNA cytosine methyltransferase [Aestuariivirga sp.]MCA3555243.1 DNA cytosine methyltransferase [Aestuariivirga sp.]